MRCILLGAMLGLMGCSSPWPKFRNPVVVNADKSPIYADASGLGEVVATVNKGDTLEFNSWDVIGEPAPGVCAVKRDARYNGFKTNAKVGYIKRNLLSIPDSTIAKEKAGKLRGIPTSLALGLASGFAASELDASLGRCALKLSSLAA